MRFCTINKSTGKLINNLFFFAKIHFTLQAFKHILSLCITESLIRLEAECLSAGKQQREILVPNKFRFVSEDRLDSNSYLLTFPLNQAVCEPLASHYHSVQSDLCSKFEFIHLAQVTDRLLLPTAQVCQRFCSRE